MKMSEETRRRLTFTKNELHETFRVYFITWDDSLPSERNISTTFEFTYDNYHWVTGVDVQFTKRRTLHHIDFPPDWSELMNKPSNVELAIRWSPLKLSKVSVSDWHNEMKWTRTTFRLNKDTNKLGVFNTHGRSVELSASDDRIEFDYVQQRNSQFEVANGYDETMAAVTLPVRQVATGKSFLFELNCAKCQLFIELDSSGIYKKSPCFESTHIKYRVLYRHETSWLDVTDSAIINTSNGLLRTTDHTLQLTNHDDKTHFVQAVFMNIEVQVPVIIWSIKDVTLVTSDTTLNRFDFCPADQTNHFTNYVDSTHQYAKVWPVARYTGLMGVTTRRMNSVDVTCQPSCKQLTVRGELFITTTAADKLDVSLVCDTKAKVTLDVSAQPVSIVGFDEHNRVQMSDKSQLTADVYSTVHVFEYTVRHYSHGVAHQVTTGAACNSNETVLFEQYTGASYTDTISSPKTSTTTEGPVVAPFNYDFIVPALSILLCISSLSLLYIITNFIRRKNFHQQRRHQHVHHYESVQQ